MLPNPIITLIHNFAANTWHPVVFKESPLPGGGPPHSLIRYKSVMHHTAGFPTREEALKSITEELVARVTDIAIGPVTVDTTEDIEWDGVDVPATVLFRVNHLTSDPT